VPKQIFKQHAFNAGEASSRLYGRFDVDKYNNACEIVENLRVLPQGPAEVRAGTQYIAETKTSSDTSILIPFKFSSSNALVLELGDNYIRFYKNKAQIESGGSPYELPTPYSSSDLSDITYVQFGNSIYFAHPDFAPRILIRESDDNWDISKVVFAPPPTVEDGEAGIVGLTLGSVSGSNVTCTASAAFFQNGDIGRQIVVITDGLTGVASIDAFTSTTVVSVNIIEEFSSAAVAANDWKMDLSTLGDITITPTGGGSGTSGETIVVTSKGAAPDLFRSSDVGKYLLVHGGTAKITEYTSATSITCVVQKSLDDSVDTSVWSIEEATWSSTRGFPRAVGIFQERLIYGGTNKQPQTLWMSEQGIFAGFGVGQDDEDSVVLDLASQRANQISWISSARELVVGTTGAEIALQQSAAGGITPTNPPDQVRTYYGSDTQTPITVGDELLFIGPNGRKIRAFRYDFNIDGFSAEDLFFLADHLTTKDATLTAISYGVSGDSLVYSVRSDGKLLVAAYERQQKVIGWTVYETDGEFEDVEVISENNEDVVYVLVKRTIDGSVVRNVEVFDSGTGERDTHIFSDSALVLYPGGQSNISGITKADPGVITTSAAHGLSNGDTIYIYGLHDASDNGMTELNGKTYTVANKTSTTFELTNSSGDNIDTSGFTTWVSGGTVNKQSTTVTGLSHLEGETVEIKAEGAAVASKTVSSGAITLDNAAGIVVVGMPYTWTLKTLRYPFGVLSDKTLLGRIRWSKVGLLVHNSSVPTMNGESLPARNGEDNMNASVPLFSGMLEYAADAWTDTGQLTITGSGPFPCTILGIFGYGSGEDY
jgi:hypothetical protein